jgi:hypothetical protein
VEFRRPYRLNNNNNKKKKKKKQKKKKVVLPPELLTFEPIHDLITITHLRIFSFLGPAIKGSPD